MIERKRFAIIQKINQTFESYISKSMNIKEGLEAISEVIQWLKAVEINSDIEQYTFNRTIEQRIAEIETQFNI